MRPTNFKKYNIAFWLPVLNYKDMLNKPLIYSEHSKNYKINHDFKHHFDFNEITPEVLVNSKVVEVYTTPIILNGKKVEQVFKLVCRISRKGLKDIVAVVGLNKNQNKLITAWLNSSNDNHSTLKQDDISTFSSSKFIYY